MASSAHDAVKGEVDVEELDDDSERIIGISMTLQNDPDST